jgi:16S rRNA (uracil1498-N3)-methyltransferase
VVELLDGTDKKYRGVVASASSAAMTVSIDRSAPIRTSSAARTEIVLAAAVIRPERMELLIQKACELGASRIVPLLAERSIVRLSRERWTQKIVRWKKIALESCKQCGRADVPVIGEPVEVAGFLKTLSKGDLFLFPTLAVAGKPLRAAFGTAPISRIVFAVGPEGDFTPEETRRALEAGAVPVTLGEAVLRSETAAFFLLSVAQFILADRA